MRASLADDPPGDAFVHGRDVVPDFLGPRATPRRHAHHVVVADRVDADLVGAEQPLAGAEDRLERRRRVGDGFADRAQHVGRGLLLLQRLSSDRVPGVAGHQTHFRGRRVKPAGDLGIGLWRWLVPFGCVIAGRKSPKASGRPLSSAFPKTAPNCLSKCAISPRGSTERPGRDRRRRQPGRRGRQKRSRRS